MVLQTKTHKMSCKLGPAGGERKNRVSHDIVPVNIYSQYNSKFWSSHTNYEIRMFGFNISSKDQFVAEITTL